MALLWMDGFDFYGTSQDDSAGMYDFASGNSYVSGRTGNCLRVTGNGSHVDKTVGGTSATAIIGFAFRYGSTGSVDLVELLETTTVHLALRIESGVLKLYRGGTLVATGTTTLAANTWYHIELKAVINDSTGTADVRLNEVSEISFSGDTRNGGTGYVNAFSLRSWIDYDYDDLFFFDAGTFRGDCKIETIYPTGAGNSTQWTPSTGSNWQNVDDTSPDDDSTYNSDGTAGHKDTFAMGNLVSTSGDVLAIDQALRYRKDDAGTRSIATVVRTGATDYDGSTVTSSTTYGYAHMIRETNPNTSAAWTISDVNGMEAGYKVVA